MKKGIVLAMGYAIFVGWMMLTVCKACASAPKLDVETATWYAFCDPSEHVNIRQSPRAGAKVTGKLYLGDAVTVDGYEDGYIHCTDLATEAGSGWVKEEYLVMSDPEELPALTVGVIHSKGRVAMRNGVCGAVKGWLRNGDVVTVLAMTEDWVIVKGGMVMRVYVDVSEEGGQDDDM